MDLSAFAALGTRLADQSRSIIVETLSRPPPVEIKADGSPVTEVDKAVERALRDAIEREYPLHGIVGEEFGSVRRDADYVWVLDPIDGTKSFMSGLPTFATLIALAYRGAPVLGIMDSPATAERWIGGDGIATRLNGNAVGPPRACADLTEALAHTSSPDYFTGTTLQSLSRVKERVRWLVYGAGCHACARLAGGFIDLALETRCEVYDYLALAPILHNSGALVSDWRGNPLTLDSGAQFIACGDARVYTQALALLAT